MVVSFFCFLSLLSLKALSVNHRFFVFARLTDLAENNKGDLRKIDKEWALTLTLQLCS